MDFVKKCLIILVAFNMSCAISIQAQSSHQISTNKEPVEYVNPHIGGIRHVLEPTHPYVFLPNSYLRVTPVRSGYTDVTLRGLPLISKKETSLAFRLSPYQGERSGLRPIISYSYDNEQVTPYSYSVILDEQETKVDFGVSHQSAMYQLNFQGQGTPFVILSSKEGQLHWDGQALSGYQSIGGGTRVYIYMRPEQTPDNHFALNATEQANQNKAKGKNTAMILQYSKSTGPITLRYGISFISTEQAKKNMRRELAGKNLQQVQDEGRKIWNKALGKITVDGGTDDDEAIFYTALYRSYYRPVAISEDGYYYSGIDGKVHADHNTTFYTDDVAWSTYRALHPLHVLIEPKAEEAILHSYLRMAGQKPYFQMPKSIDFAGDYAGMHSNHIIISMLDAHEKGLDVDLDKALIAGQNTISQKTLAPASDDSAGWLNRFYQKHGYLPAFWIWQNQEETHAEVNPSVKRQAVSVTLGTAYDEWALAQMAKKTDQDNTFQQLCTDSFNYHNLFNSGTGFFHPRGKNGAFISSFDYITAGGHGSDYYHGSNNYYTQGNGWTYRFGLQYNIPDLIDMMGGRDNFVRNLDALFSTPKDNDKEDIYLQYPNRTGNVGQFSMGNEPAFHKPYLYNYAGQPWKTQKRIRMLMRKWFQNDLMGMPGKDNGGAMSAFVVFSYMGFYPFSPGMPIYTIGSPVFNHISLALPGGGRFEIIAKNNSPDNKYIQSATLNGQPLDKPWFNHKDLKDGGELILRMGPRPNKQWGSDPDDAPPSMPFSMDDCENQ